ncbi:CMP-N-acetylneuraminic acid synthetase [Bradyrhizobium sp. LTSP849]|uniref:acylneuraminate cytidylyltransferase family protein n=1 Tax=Bradyrhizobium sp. LTSP849 TaxID=1615890 RepID=UPI0005D23CD8|nr:acylneuraminate cytidylyltransferase family protein [Bradyrhizobium sp. LTSP849]KJC34269.1 CMP-N-acetylneuraminic acid synthetase [Bradyrhizobium sp. LTSP849]
MNAPPGKPSFAALVPLRGGSKSIPGKNIKPFCGQPLCAWTLRALLDCGMISRVFVSTDSEEIAAVARSIDSRILIHPRPTHLAADNSTTEEAIYDLIDACDIPEKYLITAQATSPQTTHHDVSAAISHLAASGADSLVTCVRTRRFFWNDDATPINYDPARRPLRQRWNGTLMENGAFYISTVDRLRERSARLHGKIAVYEMDESTSIELDELSDWEALEATFRRNIAG